MGFDKDWVKVMGEDVIPLSSGSTPVAQDDTPEAVPQTDSSEDKVVLPSEAEPQAVPEVPVEVAPVEEPVPATDVVDEAVPAEVPPSTMDKDAEDLINELLGEVNQASEEQKEQGKKLEDAIEQTGDKKLLEELEQYKLKDENSQIKMAALASEYRKMLDQNNSLQAINDEYTTKMQIISDNPLLQDLLRGLYLKGRDETAVTDVESTLKQLLKEYAGLDVDELATKARGESAKSLSPGESGALVGENSVYSGLFEAGDVVPLAK